MPHNKQFDNSEFWYGYNLLREGKPLYLFDHRFNNPRWKGAVTLGRGGVTRGDVANFSGFGALLVPESTVYAKYAIIHDNNPERIYADDDSDLIVLWVSTTPERVGEHKLIPEPSESPKIVQFVMKDGNAYRATSVWLPQFLALDFETAKAIAAATDRWSLHPDIQRDFAHLLDIIHPGDPTAPLAFRLLCEAWEEVNIKGNTSLSDLPITAPENPSDWLAPFVRAEGRPASIEEVVALMVDGDFKGKVKGVLDATDGEAMKKAVLNLLGRADDRTGTEGGAE